MSYSYQFRLKIIKLVTEQDFTIILVLTVLKLHKTDGEHLRKKV